MNVGVIWGKFLPPHRGHITSILKAHTACDELYVVVSDRGADDDRLCRPGYTMPGKLRKRWLMEELSGFDNIKVVLVDESDLPGFPGGWEAWSSRAKAAVGKPISTIFGGETMYIEGCKTWFPEATYRIIDPDRSQWGISGTLVRQEPMQHWEYILGAARPLFCKKVLIVGTESCGKTTLTKKLAKVFYTSWSEEVGRYYSERYLGGDESAFMDEDFLRIVTLQQESDRQAIRTANRVTFIDTDALITQYYAEAYLGHKIPLIESFIDPSKYDLALYLTPEVKWVADGQRFLGEQHVREQQDEKLWTMYLRHGFGPKLRLIQGSSYEERMLAAIESVNLLLQA